MAGYSTPYAFANYLGEWANDAAALTEIQARKWDSTADGTGTPRNGMTYYATGAHQVRTYIAGIWVWMGTSASSTLDAAYNASAGAAAIAVDAGNVTWNLSGAHSFVVDASACTGAVDGFGVEDGTDYFRATHAAANTLDLSGALGILNIATSGAATIDSDAAATFKGASVAIDADGGTATIDATGAVSINSSAAAINIGDGAVAQAINIGTGAAARTITVGNAASTEFEVNALLVDINAGGTGMTVHSAAGLTLLAATVSSFQVNSFGNHLTLGCYGGGPQKLNLGSAGTGVDAIDMAAAAGGVSIDAVKASHFIVSGATADLTFNARAGTAITLNQLGQVALDTSFTATSIIGAFNELKNGPQWMSGTTINAATPAYTINAGDEYMVLHVDRTTAGPCAITFQSAWIAIDGNVICIKDTGRNSFVNHVTILTQHAELFEGDAAGGLMKSNGACWWIKAYGGNLYMI